MSARRRRYIHPRKTPRAPHSLDNSNPISSASEASKTRQASETSKAIKKSTVANAEIASGPAPTPAGMMIRLFCLVYDGLLLVAIWMIVTAILVPFGTSPESASHKEISLVSPNFQHYVLFPALVAVTWLFYSYFWQRAGQTLGMQTWHLKLLRMDGSLPRWSNGITRCAATCLFPVVCGMISQITWHSVPAIALSIFSGFLGNYLWMLWSPQKLAWHDQVSGTVVWKMPPEPKKKRSFFAWFSEKN